MFAKAPCPSTEDLAGWARGEVSKDKARAIGEHVDNCFECARMLSAIRSSTDLSEEGADTGNVPVFWSAEERLQLQAKLTPEATNFDATIIPQATLDLATLLGPPKNQDELGRLGKYRVLELIGKGSIGVVFRAEDPIRKRPVALKTMLPRFVAHPTARDRFRRAVRAAAALEHENIVPIHESAEERGVPYLAMPLMQGMTLEEYCNSSTRAGALPIDEVIDIGRQISNALAAAHMRGVTHRDIKPANIWLENANGQVSDATARMARHVKILDFGLIAATDDLSLLSADPALGTPAYMAPEQARGEPADSRADLFSLGSILYELATGRRPFQGPDSKTILAAVATRTPILPLALNADIPSDLSELIMALLEKSPDQRPEFAQDVSAQLDTIEQNRQQERQAKPARPEPPPPAAPPPPAPPTTTRLPAVPTTPYRPWLTWLQIAIHIWVVLYAVDQSLQFAAGIDLPAFPESMQWFFRTFGLALLGELCLVAILLMQSLYADFTRQPPRQRPAKERPWILANLALLIVLHYVSRSLGLEFEVNDEVVLAPLIKDYYLPVVGQLVVLFALICYWLYKLFWADEGH